MTRVALNLTYLDPGRTGGMEVVARALLPELIDAATADGIELVAIMNERGASADGPWRDLETATIPVDIASRVAWVRAEIFGVPRAAKHLRADLLHSLGNLTPLRASMPHSVTVHDLIHHRVRPPGLAMKSRTTGWLVERGARAAQRVTVVSHQTADDLVEIARVPRDRIDVVPNGVAPPAIPATPEDVLRGRLGLGDRPLILCPSARQPHKNLDRLLRAHAALQGPRPLLVLPGYATGGEDALRRLTASLGIDRDVRWLGWVEQAELEGLYACSRMLVFPSLYEGFGLPVLEAMLRGLPVACSDRGSLAEVAGDAALLFDPEQTGQITAAMARLLTDEPLRATLTRAGVPQARQYTWSAAAAGYIASFRRTLAA